MRTAAGAARYKQPIGSIIVRRGGRDFNLADMTDFDLIEMMHDGSINEKSPHVYEAAFTEWARRQPDVEPEPDWWPPEDPFPEDGDMTRLELLGAELDQHLAILRAPDGATDDELERAIEMSMALNERIAFEQRLAAVDVPGTSSDEEATTRWLQNDSGADTFAVDARQARRHEIQAKAWELSERDGISYYEALARVQDKPIERVHRDEFLALASDEMPGSPTYRKATAALHAVSVNKWIVDMENETSGYLIKREFEGQISAAELWSMNQVTADKYMSDEARAWFDEHGRVTLTDVRGMIDAGMITTDPDAVLETFGTIGADVRSSRPPTPNRRRKSNADRLRDATRAPRDEDDAASSPTESPVSDSTPANHESAAQPLPVDDNAGVTEDAPDTSGPATQSQIDYLTQQQQDYADLVGVEAPDYAADRAVQQLAGRYALADLQDEGRTVPQLIEAGQEVTQEDRRALKKEIRDRTAAWVEKIAANEARRWELRQAALTTPAAGLTKNQASAMLDIVRGGIEDLRPRLQSGT